MASRRLCLLFVLAQDGSDMKPSTKANVLMSPWDLGKLDWLRCVQWQIDWSLWVVCMACELGEEVVRTLDVAIWIFSYPQGLWFSPLRESWLRRR